MQDIPDVTVATPGIAQAANVRVVVDEAEILSETLYGDDAGNVCLHDLPYMLEPFIADGLHTVSINGYSFKAFYCRKMIKEFTSPKPGLYRSWLDKNFLDVTCVHVVAHDEPIMIWMMSASTRSLSAQMTIAYEKDGILKQTIKSGSVSVSANMPYALITTLDAVTAMVESGGTVLGLSMTIGGRRNVYRRMTGKESLVLKYDNAFGCAVYLALQGELKLKPEYEFTTAIINSKTHNVNIEEKQIYEFSTAAISDGVHAELSDAIRAKNVSMLLDGYAVDIVFTSADLSHSDNRYELQGVTFSFRRAINNRMGIETVELSPIEEIFSGNYVPSQIFAISDIEYTYVYAPADGGTAKTTVDFNIYSVLSDGSEQFYASDQVTLTHYFGSTSDPETNSAQESIVYTLPDGSEETITGMCYQYGKEEVGQKVKVSWDIWHYNVIHCEWDSTNSYLLEQTYNVGEVIVPPAETWHSAESDKDLDDFDFLGWAGFTEGMIATEDVTFQGRFRDKNDTGEENDEVVIQWDVWDASVIHCVWSSNGSYLLSQTYRKGETIVPPTETYVSAESNKNVDDYELYEWEGYTQGMQATKSVRFQGRFRLKSAGDVYYDVNAYADPTDGGTVTGGGRKLAGTSVSLKATPSMNYDFEKWEIQVSGESEPRTSTDNPYSISAIAADVDAYAKFKRKQNGGGSGDDTDNPGEEDDDDNVDDNPPYYELRNLTETVVSKAPANGGYAQTNIRYDLYRIVNQTASDEGGETKVNSGYVVLSYTFDENTSTEERKSPQQSHEFTYPNGDKVTVTGYCYQLASANEDESKPDVVNISITLNPNSSGIARGSGKYSVGDTIILSAIPDNGFEFVSWTGGGVVLTDNPVQFTAEIGMPTQWVANFKEDPIVEYIVTNVSEHGNSRVVAPYSGGKASSIFGYKIHAVRQSGKIDEEPVNLEYDGVEFEKTFDRTANGCSVINDGYGHVFHTEEITKKVRHTIEGVEYEFDITGIVYQEPWTFDRYEPYTNIVNASDTTACRPVEMAPADGGLSKYYFHISKIYKYGDGTDHIAKLYKSFTKETLLNGTLSLGKRVPIYDSENIGLFVTVPTPMEIVVDGESMTVDIPFYQRPAAYNTLSGNYIKFVNRRSIPLNIHFRITTDKETLRHLYVPANGEAIYEDFEITLASQSVCYDEGYEPYATEA